MAIVSFVCHPLYCHKPPAGSAYTLQGTNTEYRAVCASTQAACGTAERPQELNRKNAIWQQTCESSIESS